MFKRNVSLFTAIIFFITLFPLVFAQNAYAYQSSSYFNNLKIGLMSMSSTSLTVTLNGDYTLNGQVYPSGSVLNLGISGTSIMLNGTAQSQISLIPNGKANLLTITSGTVSNKYMGSFLIKLYNGKLLPINIIDIETYLKGVVSFEMSDNFPIEALKAQAVAARNFALSRIGWESAKGYDFDDTTNYQVYKGYNPIYTNSISAVEQTRGQVLLYNDQLVETLYSAWHGGVSEDSENVWGNYVPYLRSVVDPYESDPWPNGSRVLTNAAIQTALVAKGYLAATDTFLKLDLNSITKFPSGRVSNINIIYKNSTGLQLTKSVTKDNTRTFLTLPSNLYIVTYDAINGAYTFSGKGNGHGLGMSQIGARNRAAAGQTYDQILKFYYQNVYLQSLIAKATLNAFTESSNALFVNNTISFNATAGAGNGYGYLFKYIIKNGTNTIYTKDYNISPSLDYVPTTAGSYTVEVYVKDLYSISDYDDKNVSYFTVYGAPFVNNFTTSKTDTLIGQGVAANVDVQGGSSSYLYKYEVTKDGTIIATRDFLADKSFTFTPSEAGSYTMTVYVKDSISPNSYDLKQSQSFTAYNALTFTSFNKDATNVFTGNTVNFSSTVSGGSNKGIAYKYVVLKDGQTISTTDFTSNSSFTYIPSNAGNYEVEIYAADAISDNPYDVVNKMSFTVYDYSKLGSTTEDKTQLFKNDTINFSTNGVNGSGSYLYKFVITKDNVVLITKDYSSSNTFSYTPTLEGNYNAAVYVKDSLSQKAYDDVKNLAFTVLQDAKISTSQTNKSQYLAGQTINLTTTSTLGSGNYLYKYVTSKDGIILSTLDYNTAGSLLYKTDNSGTYSITEYMKDILSQKTYDDMKVLSIPVYIEPTMTYTSSKNAALVGNAVNYSITEVNGSGKAQYRFVVIKDGAVVTDSGYTDSNTFTFTPSIAGAYQVTGYMKDALSENAYDAQNTLSLNVYNPQLASVTISGYFYEGKSLTFNASSTGVSPSGFSYKYELYNNGVLVASNSFNALGTYTISSMMTGTYTVKVYGKDGLSTNAYDSLKQFSITINSKPLFLSSLPLSYGLTSSDVTALQNALIKLGYPLSGATGYFGTLTRSTVISFQTNWGLSGDGIVGNMTYGALNDALIQKSGIKNLTF